MKKLSLDELTEIFDKSEFDWGAINKTAKSDWTEIMRRSDERAREFAEQSRLTKEDWERVFYGRWFE